MNIKKMDRKAYNELIEKPKCIVTGLSLTWDQYKAFGRYSSSWVRNLYSKLKDVEKARAVIKDWVFCPATNSHYPDVEGWSRSTGGGRVPSDVRAEFYKQTFQATQICTFPGCQNTVPFENLNLHTCCVQHYNQGNRIRRGDYPLEDLKYKCALDEMKFLRTEDVAAHLRSTHDFSDEQMEKYFRTYILKPEDNQGFCKWCHEPTALNNFSQGYFDFCHNTSCNVSWHNAHTDRLEKCSKAMKRIGARGDAFHRQPGYWLKRGFSQAETEEILEQLTNDHRNDVSTLMKRHGLSKVEAEAKRKEITRKWITKVHHGLIYTPESQKFFWALWREIKPYISVDDVVFATFNRGKVDQKFNREQLVETQRSFFKLDFYIASLAFVIEFDEPGHSGRREKDLRRDNEIRAAFQNRVTIHRLLAKLWRKNPEGTVNQYAFLIRQALARANRRSSQSETDFKRELQANQLRIRES